MAELPKWTYIYIYIHILYISNRHVTFDSKKTRHQVLDCCSIAKLQAVCCDAYHCISFMLRCLVIALRLCKCIGSLCWHLNQPTPHDWIRCERWGSLAKPTSWLVTRLLLECYEAVHKQVIGRNSRKTVISFALLGHIHDFWTWVSPCQPVGWWDAFPSWVQDGHLPASHWWWP